MPDWPVLAAIAHEKLAEHQPVAISDARAVTAVSAIARGQGVRRGMRLRTARSICPEVVFIGGDPARDARVFERVLQAVDDVVVGIEVVRPGLVVLPAAGPLRHWGRPEEVAEQLISAVAHHTGWESSVGMGAGLLGAVSAARHSLLLSDAQTLEFLQPLPISELITVGILVDKQERSLIELVDLWQRLGVATLGQLAQLPPADVGARFGLLGQWAQQLVTGQQNWHGTKAQAQQEVVAFLDIDPPAQRVDQAAFAARQVASELHEKLLRSGLTCGRVQIVVRSEAGDELQRTWRHEGELNEREMTDRVRWQLEGWISGRSGQGPDSGLVHILLNALDLAPAGVAQGRLWGEISEKDRHAQRSLTRVQHLLGAAGVFRPVVEGGRDPQEQVRMVAWGDELVALRDPNLPWPGRLPDPAPSLVYRKPIAVEVTDVGGRHIEISQRGELTSTPHWLISATQRNQITGWAGPWQLAQRWWEGQPMRARFQLLLGDKHAVLVSYQGNKWQVEARYD